MKPVPILHSDTSAFQQHSQHALGLIHVADLKGVR